MKFDFEDREKKLSAKKIVKEVLIWVVEIALVIALAFCIIKYAVEKTEMTGVSMESTLQDGDKILINKISYRIHAPERFDVIVFKQSNREHSFYNVKRIIGLPGEKVHIKDNTIYINDAAVEDVVVADVMNNPGLAGDGVVLDENEYFVLGDNRNNSEDSRFANVGNITRDEIVGKAWVRLNSVAIIGKLNLKSNNTQLKQEMAD